MILLQKKLHHKDFLLSAKCQTFPVVSKQSSQTRDREMEKQGDGCHQLVLVPYPLQGHITPMLQLGHILHSRGFSITVAHTKFNAPNTSNHRDFVFIPLWVNSPSENNNSDHDFVALIMNLNSSFRVSLQELLIELIEKQEQPEELPCIIYDPLMYCAEAVACHLKLPSIMFRTSCATLMVSYYVCPELKTESYSSIQGSKAHELVTGLHPLRFKDLPFYEVKNQETFLQVMAATQNIGTSSAIVVNSLGCLEKSFLEELQQICQVPVFSIGPVHKLAPAFSSSLMEEDRSCIQWLDKQVDNSVIYVSLGSIASADEKELTEMAWGLANSKQPFLWVLRPGSVHGSKSVDLLPEEFKASVEERGCIVKWAPQKEVLAHRAVGGFWSHCGWNSTIESICEGVPMICRPLFGDQKIDSRLLSHVWRVGIELENELERGEIERVIRRLIVEKEGEEMRQRAVNLRLTTEHETQKDGPSYNSLNKLVKFIMSI